jgi:hypothetical protein
MAETTPTPNQVRNLVKSLIRSLMPMLYSLVASAIAHFGYHVSLATVIQIVGGGFVGLTVILHAAEKRWPWVGVLLGYLGAPTYAPPVKVTQAAQIAALQQQLAELQNKTT